MTINTVTTEAFFTYVDSFVDYRKTVYESSEQTIRSNLSDIRLFERFIGDHGYSTINGEAVMGSRMYLKKDRLNAGNSINRKLFSLRSYGHYLKVSEVEGAESLPFRDVLKIRTGYGHYGYSDPGVRFARIILQARSERSRGGVSDYADAM